ncbi:MAG: MerR family transcriptional regulator [Granulicella sp.]
MAQHGINARSHASVGTQRSSQVIADKLYFRIGEVAQLCEVPAYVLRFWESEFPQLKPNKGGTGQRLYRRRDVEMALHIKTLLYDEGFTIAGARQSLKAERKHKEPQLSLAIVQDETAPLADRTALRRLKKEMQELLNLLAASPLKAAVHPIRGTKSLRTAPPSPGSDDLFG